ncbi:MAG: ABC transporter ATP-binding protein [Roseburia sp.]|nr:ABC transporter ATP-binding protein [Roseburia sp.]
MVQLTDVKKRLGHFFLENITFTLPEGYIMGLIGQNGAGKSTILKILLGLYTPDGGEIRLFGTTYQENEKFIKNNIGYVLSEDGLFAREMTLLENARLYGKYYENYSESLFLSYALDFGLKENRKVKKLSKGEYLKFQFAFALAHQPKLLLLDEPTANFDPDFRQKFLHIITDYIKDGKKSVILATHLTEDLDQIADYITFVDAGSLLLSMDRENLNKHFRMVAGEEYKVKLLPRENIIYKETGEYGTKALVSHGRWSQYDNALLVTYPTVEELMYFTLKGKRYEKK